MYRLLSTILLLFVSFLLFDSCKENAVEVPHPPREVSMTLSGTLAFWNAGDGYSIMAVAEVPSLNDSRKEGIDTASISSNGAFTITLHSIYDKYCNYSINVSEPDCDVNINPSPYTMRQAKINFEIYKGGNYKGYVTGIVHRVGNDTVGTYYVNYTGYSSTGTVTGFKTCVNNDTTYTTYYEYNISTNSGWTKVVRSVVYRDTNYVAYLESNNDPQFGTVWEYSMK
ncbi:MAG: hypothetical protein LWX07_06540 [Bacteroidetes bacterium]|nr:hypothetical protein [Bacteroidota bacterium]